MQLRVAGAQLPVRLNVEANVAAILRGIEYAEAQRADILLTPEGALSGYTPNFDQAAVELGLRHVTAAARAVGIGLALGTCFVEPEDGACYNQIRFYDRDGAFLGFHSKVLRCGSLDDHPEGEINDYRASRLKTFVFEGVRIGGLICNDLWANPGCTPVPDPHLTQRLAGWGARVIFHAVNGGRDGSEWSQVAWQYHESNLRMRARAGNLWIVTVDNCHPANWRCSAPSGVIDPQGEWACRTGPQGEQYFAHTLDLDER
ncbi:MAG: carbon-nitrogen hydrolase family protein [Chloroflexi bacterium]|nr:carbon-nitrogen hydrolase family protein [Chloroflexota bacterium]